MVLLCVKVVIINYIWDSGSWYVVWWDLDESGQKVLEDQDGVGLLSQTPIDLFYDDGTSIAYYDEHDELGKPNIMITI